jgi:nucleotide-binding universal stress UspA family protein
MAMTSETNASPVLLCLDLESGSRELAEYAAGFTARCKLPLRILHVLQRRLSDADIEHSRQRLADICREILPGVAPDHIHVATGLPEDHIVEIAARYGAGTILLGRRKRLTVDRIYVGSTTSAVISLASRPVLVVPLRHDSDMS